MSYANLIGFSYMRLKHEVSSNAVFGGIPLLLLVAPVSRAVELAMMTALKIICEDSLILLVVSNGSESAAFQAN